MGTYHLIRRLFQSHKLGAIASGALFVLSASLGGPALAYTQEATGQPAAGATSSTATVNTSDLPRMNGAEALPSEVPRPRNGLSDPEYDSLKAAAAEQGKGAPGLTGPAPASSQTDRKMPAQH